MLRNALFAKRLSRSWVVIAIVVAACTCTLPAWAADPLGVEGRHGMVVAPEAEAARVGMEVLSDGGNAVDAAVAVGLAIAVTFPEAGNLGGGGFLLYRHDAETYHALDFRERAPGDLSPEQFLGEDGRPDPRLSLMGGLAVGVPGTPAGLYDAHQRWGKLPWKRLVAPAIRLAEKGYLLNHYQERSFARAQERLAQDPEAARIFLQNGQPLQAGDRLKQPDLAKTLRLLAKQGPEGFYQGRVGRAVVETVRVGGGAMSLQDLKEYRTALREPLRGTYRGHQIISFPPPSSGSVALLQTLAMLERFDLAESGPQSSQTLHRVAEATRRAFADRSRWLGDPDYFDVPVAELLDADYLAERSASIDDARASDSLKIAPRRIAAYESAETTHVSIAAADGSAVSMTVTLNSSYGNATVATGTGVLLNNEVDDFAVAPGVPNQYGLIGGEANAIEGGKRPLSSMTPTMVEQSTPSTRPLLIVGSPGGSRIITAVLQVILNVIDHDMRPQAAVNAPRAHHQWLPDQIYFERRSFPQDVLEALRARGHEVQARALIGCTNAIGLSEEGHWIGAADPRRESYARGY